MFKKLILLAGILLVVPACLRDSSSYTTLTTTTRHTAPVERAEYDEELGAFVVKDDDNKFSAALAAQTHQEEELKAASSELKAGDIHSDSAQYGLKPVYFEFNKNKVGELQPDQKPVMEHNGRIVKQLTEKGYRVSVEGHACDSAGSTEYNIMLSEDRARSVKEAFEKDGCNGEILYVGYGCEHLIVATGDRSQQAPNRRCEIYAYLPEEM